RSSLVMAAPGLGWTGCGQHEPAGSRQTRLSAELSKVYAFRGTRARSHLPRNGVNPGLHGVLSSRRAAAEGEGAGERHRGTGTASATLAPSVPGPYDMNAAFMSLQHNAV